MSGDRAWSGPAPEDIAAWTLVQASHAVARQFTGALGELGLTPTQFGVLVQLDLHPGMTNAQLARAVLVTPQATSELMGSLERLGLVEREPAGGRGRPVPARLTADGRAALARCGAAVARVEDSLGLGPEDRRQLNRLLHVVLAAAHRR